MLGEPNRRQVLSSIGATLGWATVSGRVTGRQSSDRLVYAASETGELAAFSAATGERQWGYEFPNNSELLAEKGGPPLVWNGTVYLGAQQRLHAVDAATGEREWVFEGGYSAMWPPTIHDGTVYVVNTRGSKPDSMRRETSKETPRCRGYRPNSRCTPSTPRRASVSGGWTVRCSKGSVRRRWCTTVQCSCSGFI